VPNVMSVLRAEIRRLARKETRQELSSMKKQLNQTKRLLAESRRRINELEARAKHVARGMRSGPAAVRMPSSLSATRAVSGARRPRMLAVRISSSSPNWMLYASGRSSMSSISTGRLRRRLSASTIS